MITAVIQFTMRGMAKQLNNSDSNLIKITLNE